jgi:hypothetical protein
MRELENDCYSDHLKSTTILAKPLAPRKVDLELLEHWNEMTQMSTHKRVSHEEKACLQSFSLFLCREMRCNGLPSATKGSKTK